MESATKGFSINHPMLVSIDHIQWNGSKQGFTLSWQTTLAKASFGSFKQAQPLSVIGQRAA